MLFASEKKKQVLTATLIRSDLTNVEKVSREKKCCNYFTKRSIKSQTARLPFSVRQIN